VVIFSAIIGTCIDFIPPFCIFDLKGYSIRDRQFFFNWQKILTVSGLPEKRDNG